MEKVTEAVHAAGSVINLQLWHLGSQSHSSFHPKTGKIWALSAVAKTGMVPTATGERVLFEVP
jgi:2,4-dienoyl-CoA reductase-like NADH-dependent reductase (Old Yellow Enzyme family)